MSFAFVFVLSLLFQDDETNLGFVGLAVSLGVTLVVVPLNRFLLSRPIAFLLLAFYAVFLLLSVLIEAGILKPFL
jgi:hypothetical protein